jgi:hypothetical protein
MPEIYAIVALTLIFACVAIFIAFMRAFSRSRFVIRLSGNGQERWYKCPDCSGGAQLNGKPIPVTLHRDKGYDAQGPFFQSRDANVNSCNTCRGRGRLFTAIDRDIDPVRDWRESP